MPILVETRNGPADRAGTRGQDLASRSATAADMLSGIAMLQQSRACPSDDQLDPEQRLDETAEGGTTIAADARRHGSHS